MATGGYIGVDGVAKKIKKGYVSPEGTARAVKKGYMGIGGVARPIWSSGGGKIEQYGNVTPMSVNRVDHSTTSIGKYLLFLGGNTVWASQETNSVDAYDSSLVKTNPATLSTNRAHAFAASNLNYALIAGGNRNGVPLKTVEAYDSDLTKTSASDLSSARRGLGTSQYTSGKVGQYCLFISGSVPKGYTFNQKTVDAYDSSLSKVSVSFLTNEGLYAAVAGNENYCIAFFTGQDRYTSNNVECYDESLTKSILQQTSGTGNGKNIGSNVGEYLMSIGTVVNAFDCSLTRMVPEQCSEIFDYSPGCGISFNGYYAAAFGEGRTSVPSTPAIAYDSSLTKTIIPRLLQPRSGCSGGFVGNYALISGGRINNNNNLTNSVEAYTLV